jgi:RHS repeat-associated protein
MTRLYNEAGQLTQQKDIVVATSEIINQFDFKYDAAGNIIEEKTLFEPDPEINLEMTYQAANRLATYNGHAVELDSDGNMITGPLNGELTNFTFDSRNRLIQAGSTVYRYDAENQRIGVNQTNYVVNSQPTLSQILVKTEADGTQTFYVYGLGLVGQETNGEYTNYHFDLRGSTVALTDKTAQVIERFQYSPYGLLLSGDATKTPFLFNGMYGVMTDSNGLYYMRARFYSPDIRRFINQDILLGNIADGQTLNRFAHVTGNPISFVDPLGLTKCIQIEKSGQVRSSNDNIIACLIQENFGNIIERNTITRTVDALEILSLTDDEMKIKNVRGTDQFFHCLGMCRATTAISDPDIVRNLGKIKELRDYLLNVFGLYGDGWLSHREMLKDIQADLEANELGIQCPSTVSCQEQCKRLLDNLLERRREFMKEYRTEW